MELTLRQLLPQLSGLIHVVQPKKGEKADLTIFYSDYDTNTYFSNEELDQEIEYVIAINDTLNITMKEVESK